jgi:hypothetical protein
MNFLVWQLPSVFIAVLFVVVWWRDRKFSEVIIRELRDELKRTSEDANASLDALRVAHERELAVAVEKAFRAGEATNIRVHADEIVDLRKEQQADIEKMLRDSRDYLDAQRKALEVDKNEAVRTAREFERLEWESRAKAFSVQISPFVRVTEERTLMTTIHVVESGFEHQLMVHGVPAFEPHQTVSNREVHKGQSEHLDALVSAAIEVAKGLASGKVGPMGTLVTMGNPIKRFISKDASGG